MAQEKNLCVQVMGNVTALLNVSKVVLVNSEEITQVLSNFMSILQE